MGGKPPIKTKVMIYAAPDVHQAMEHVAVDERRSTSSLYIEAARALLKARGRQVVDGPPVAPPAPTASEIAEAIDRQGRRIEELHAAMVDVVGTAPRGGQGPAGTKAAGAMKVMLGILRQAGPGGLKTRDLTVAMRQAGIPSGTEEAARAVLRGAGLVRCEVARWMIEPT